MSDLSRRTFLASAATAALFHNPARAIDSDAPVLGMVACGGRGTELAKLFSKTGARIGWVCDPDRDRMGSLQSIIKKDFNEEPKTVPDFRKILDEKAIDAIVVATPNHWHAPAAILGVQAGKHVYVEKPCSHTPQEGVALVANARKHKRQVQMGNQRRSYVTYIAAMKELQEGVLGRVYLAKSWYYNNRPTIGTGKEQDPPEGIDWLAWQGPVPGVKFRSNYLHYNWHWFWNWGNGELGNNGVHTIDICRWGLGVTYPTKVTSAGGRYRYQDDQETPDTQQVAFEFADNKTITWEGMSCNVPPGGNTFEIIFYGEKGSMVCRDNGYTIHDPKGKEIKKSPGNNSLADHLTNFIQAVKGTAKLNSEIELGHQSTLLCHLGNIAQRTGRTLKCDPKTGKILDDAAAMKLWSKTYAKGFEKIADEPS